MATVPTLVTSGSQTANVGSEHTLFSTTTPGVYTFNANVGNLANGDVVEFWLQNKVLSAGSYQNVMIETRGHVQGIPHVKFPPVEVLHGINVVLKQTDGTSRAFPWEVIQL